MPSGFPSQLDHNRQIHTNKRGHAVGIGQRGPAGWHCPHVATRSKPVVSVTWVEKSLATALRNRMASLTHQLLRWRQKRGTLKMFIQTINNSQSRKNAGGKYLLPVLVALAFALTIGPSKAQAQIVDELTVKVPFAFQAGNAKLPAGEYRIHMMDDSNLMTMQISNVDGSSSALLQVQQTDAKSAPAKSELIFNRYGDLYFLADVFEQGDAS